MGKRANAATKKGPAEGRPSKHFGDKSIHGKAANDPVRQSCPRGLGG